MARAFKVYITRLVVEGAGTFPVDMLRYDSCCPETQDDVAEMTGRLSGKRRVVLRRFSRSGVEAERSRWRSFGWTVVSEVAT
jgi:hypothetical protein